jgi:hypothetical protein
MNEQLPNMARGSERPRAYPGDRFVVAGHHVGQQEREGEILEVLGEEGGPPYLVRWDDGRTSEVFPGPDAYVRHVEGG